MQLFNQIRVTGILTINRSVFTQNVKYIFPFILARNNIRFQHFYLYEFLILQASEFMHEKDN